ncbi:MAG: RdgB/HAM1 family non-canonical purine NTP pyrophosphatase [Flavobacteriales bacterium]|nr:RdgB/HAM1 family non-canonical purine NTP pyrophosphatase [Flavobacteriales bacterium]
MKMVLCTGNAGKVAELLALLPSDIELVGLNDVGMPSDLPETQETLEGNAIQKATYVFERTGLTCIADDTGLEVHALGGAPGVRSARYAGMDKDPQANIHRLLAELQGRSDRSARFRTVVALVGSNGVHTFEGVVEGAIAYAPMGSKGFGYDPVFVPEDGGLTFAEMDSAAKNAISHRARAVQALVRYLAAAR